MVQVRWAHRGEAPKVYPLLCALVKAEDAEPPGPGTFSRTWGRSFREGSGFRFAVAVAEDKRLVGCMSLHEATSTWKGLPTVGLEDFFVLPELRGQGIGAAMLAFAEEQARGLGAARLELHVLRRNERAQHLYQRAGYEDSGYLWMQKKLPPPDPAMARSARASAAKAAPRPEPAPRPERGGGRGAEPLSGRGAMPQPRERARGGRRRGAGPARRGPPGPGSA